jgi:hypothetical protein
MLGGAELRAMAEEGFGILFMFHIEIRESFNSKWNSIDLDSAAS